MPLLYKEVDGSFFFGGLTSYISVCADISGCIFQSVGVNSTPDLQEVIVSRLWVSFRWVLIIYFGFS